MAQIFDVVTQIAHESDKVFGNVSYVSGGFKVFTGIQGFRGYDWLQDVRPLSAAGNFRGMVLSSRWGTAYQVVSSADKWIGNIATVASLASVVVEMAPQFESVYGGNDSRLVKAQRLSLLTSIVAQKTLAGIVTGGVHLVYAGLVAGCNATAKASGDGKIATAAYVCSQVFQDADALVQKTANYLTDPSNQQRAIQSLITISVAH